MKLRATAASTVVVIALGGAVNFSVPARADDTVTVSRADAMKVRLIARKDAKTALNKAISAAKATRDRTVRKAATLKNRTNAAKAVAIASQRYLEAANSARSVYRASLAKSAADYNLAVGRNVADPTASDSNVV